MKLFATAMLIGMAIAMLSGCVPASTTRPEAVTGTRILGGCTAQNFCTVYRDVKRQPDKQPVPGPR